MPKSKRGTALFDLFPKDGPGGADAPNVPSSKPRSEGLAGSEEAAQIGHEGKTAASGLAENAEAVATEGGLGRRVELVGDRICFSLTSVSAGLAVFVALALVVGVFSIGRNVGHRSGYGEGVVDGRSSFEAHALSEIEVARRMPPATDVLSGLLDAPPATDSAHSRSGTAVSSPEESESSRGWVRGFTYIVVQEFLAQRQEDAAKAQVFLATNGVATEIVTGPSGAIKLITTQGFNRNDPAQREMADRLHSRVGSIGARYFAGGGRYKLSGYLKTLKGNRW